MRAATAHGHACPQTMVVCNAGKSGGARDACGCEASGAADRLPQAQTPVRPEHDLDIVRRAAFTACVGRW